MALASRPLLANSPTIGFDHENLVLIQGNSLVAMSNSFLPKKPQGGILNEVEAENILNCLARLESNNNPKAYNPKDIDGRPKFGIYQFDLATFKSWCVLKYGLPDDIWNAEVQKECAYKMIFQDKQGWQWGVFYKCLQ